MFAGTALAQRAPTVSYRVHIDSAAPDDIDVTMSVRGATPTLRLAMKVHPEYDAAYWHNLSFSDANVHRLDSTLWQVSLPGGSGDVHYTLHVPPSPPIRRAWQVTVRADGALLNPPDVFLYLPDFPRAAASVHLDIPWSWRVATSLDTARSSHNLRAPDAATLLDAPILLGHLRSWRFRDRGTAYTAVYWPLPNASPFDTLAFVDELRRVSHAALDVFGSTPDPRFVFLLQDGADDALEHRASVTIGIPSADLAADPHTHLEEIAHESFHAWNLVAIHPDTYGELTYRPFRTTGLWWGEGFSFYYADVLPRRAGLVDSGDSRAAHVVDLLTRYAGSVLTRRASPEAASLAFEDSPLVNPNATTGYYLQGELLGLALDGIIRDSTHDRRGLDDLMRALYARSRRDRGISSARWEATADSVCRCHLHRFFETQVRGLGPISLDESMARLGWRIAVDTAPAMNAQGEPLPDLRIRVVDDGRFRRLFIPDSTAIWARAGLRSGDVLLALDGVSVDSLTSFYQPLRRHHIGDTVTIDARRDGEDAPMHVVLTMAGYQRPRVRLVDMDPLTPEQQRRRARWLAGW
jgi:predicted metalloprotease with PDZ domain